MQFPDEKIASYGFQAHHFQYDGRECIVVEPAIPLPGKRWVWKAEFFAAFPKFELEMLHRGYYICFMNVDNSFGCPDAMKNFDHFYELLTGEYGFDRHPILLGLSRGGLYIYNWSCANPDKVGCVYGDNPVCAIKNWPAGKGKGPGNPENMAKLLRDYHFTTEEEALALPTPIEKVGALVEAGVPIIHVAATEDMSVAIEDNTDVMEARVKELGGVMKVFRHPGGHHPHGLDDPKPVADWIEANFKACSMAEKLFLFDLDGTALGGYEPYALFPQHFCEFLDRIHNEGWDWGINSAWDMPGQWDLAGKSPVKSRPSVLIVSFGRGIYDCRSGEPVAVEPYCREMEKRLEIYEQEILLPALQPVLDEGKHRDVIRRRHNYSVEYDPEEIDTATYIHESPAWQSMIKSGNFEVMPLPGAVRVRSTFCTKAAPMHLLEPVFGYKPEHVVTAGDGTPDIHLVSSPYAKYAVTPANGDQMLKDYVSIHGGAIGKQDYAAGITEAFETLRNEKKSEQEKRYAECN